MTMSTADVDDRMIRIGIVGAGGIATQHLACIERHSDAVVAGVTDLDDAAARGLATAAGAPVYPSVAAMLPHVDAVYVLTPPRARVSIIRQAAEAGKAILCEKPLAATVRDAEQIVDLVRSARVPLMMGFMRRWHQPMRDLKQLIDSGALGRPVQIVRTRAGRVNPPPGNWRTHPDQRCGVTMESLSHDIDLLRWLGGEITEAAGVVTEARPDLPGFDDNVCATVRFRSGAIGALQLTWSSAVGYNHTAVVGERGTAVLDGRGMWRSETLRSSIGAGERVVDYPEAVAEDMGYTGETDAFVAIVHGQDVPYPCAEDGEATVRISQHILTSSLRAG